MDESDSTSLSVSALSFGDFKLSSHKFFNLVVTYKTSLCHSSTTIVNTSFMLYTRSSNMPTTSSSQLEGKFSHMSFFL